MSITQIIQQTYSDLKQQQDFSPLNHVINNRLSNLVSALNHSFCLGHVAKDPALHLERTELPHLCGKAECEMEKYWARQFNAKSALQTKDLKEFWYYDNYKALWDIEKTLFAGVENHHRMVFLGSGALPLTVMIAALENPSLRAVCVDFDPEACALSQELIAKLGLDQQIDVACAAAQDFPYKADDFVVCASLIEQKEELYHVLQTIGVDAFAVRDAEDVYCYLYAPSPLPNPAHYKETRRTIPVPACINTTRFFEKAGR